MAISKQVANSASQREHPSDRWHISIYEVERLSDVYYFALKYLLLR
jgi:hypothetical protein